MTRGNWLFVGLFCWFSIVVFAGCATHSAPEEAVLTDTPTITPAAQRNPTQVFRDSLRDELAVQLERIDALAARADAISGVCTSRTRGRMQRYTDRIKMAYNGLVYKIKHNPSITMDALVIEADEVQSVMLSAILDLEALCLK